MLKASARTLASRLLTHTEKPNPLNIRQLSVYKPQPLPKKMLFQHYCYFFSKNNETGKNLQETVNNTNQANEAAQQKII